MDKESGRNRTNWDKHELLLQESTMGLMLLAVTCEQLWMSTVSARIQLCSTDVLFIHMTQRVSTRELLGSLHSLYELGDHKQKHLRSDFELSLLFDSRLFLCFCPCFFWAAPCPCHSYLCLCSCLFLWADLCLLTTASTYMSSGPVFQVFFERR